MAAAEELRKKINGMREKITPEMRANVDEVKLQIFHHSSKAHRALDERAPDYKHQKDQVDAACFSYEKKLWASQSKPIQNAHNAMLEIEKLEKDLQKLRGVIFI